MSGIRKKQINFTKESILALLQEIYNDLTEERTIAMRLLNQMRVMMKEPEDMTLIGPVIKEQQKIINSCTEKKISLSKAQTAIWQKADAVSKENFTLQDLDFNQELLDNLIKEDKEEVKPTEEIYTLDKKDSSKYVE